MKKPMLLMSIATLILTSCSQSKQFDSCTDMQSDLKYKLYSNLEKEYGTPIKKEKDKLEYFVIWEGVGVKGKNVEMVFELDYAGTVAYPSMFRGVYNCAN